MKGLINAIKWEVTLDFKEYLRYRIRLLMDFIIFTGTILSELSQGIFKLRLQSKYSVVVILFFKLIIIGSLIIVVQTILLFVANTLSPSRSIWIHGIPFAARIDIVRNIYMGNKVLPRDIAIYILVYVLWFMIGSLCFKMALSYEKKYGAFDSY